MKDFIIALKGKPLAVLNVAFIILIAGIFTYLMTKPIDVLQDWRIELVQKPDVAGQLVTYNPNTSLIFNSSSNKVSTAKGTSNRVMECRDGAGNVITVQLDRLPATRPTGVQPVKANQVIVPDTSQFDGLPKTCKLAIDIFYDNVVLWRDHVEHAETEEFVVDLPNLTDEDLSNKILELERQLEELRQLRGGSSPSRLDAMPQGVAPSQPQQPTTVAPTPSPEPEEVVPPLLPIGCVTGLVIFNRCV